MVNDHDEEIKQLKERHLIGQMYTLTIERDRIEETIGQLLDKLATVASPGEWKIELPDFETNE